MSIHGPFTKPAAKAELRRRGFTVHYDTGSNGDYGHGSRLYFRKAAAKADRYGVFDIRQTATMSRMGRSGWMISAFSAKQTPNTSTETTSMTKKNANHPSPFSLDGAKFYGPIVRKAIEAAMAPYGVRVASQKFTYGDKSCVLVSFAGSAPTETSEAKAWTRQACDSFGIPFDALGQTFVHDGRTYRVAGLRPRKLKRPVALVTEDGKTYYGSVAYVKSFLDAATKVPAKKESKPASRAATKKVRGSKTGARVPKKIRRVR